MDDTCIYISLRGGLGQSQLGDRLSLETDGNRLFQSSDIEWKGKWQSERRIRGRRCSQRAVRGALSEHKLEFIEVNRFNDLKGPLVGQHGSHLERLDTIIQPSYL
jgi:hypothetical protein